MRTVVLLLCSAAALGADPALPPLFSDHMVLQQDRAVPVWGTAAAGERVVVQMAGQTAVSVADAAGRWRVQLGPLPPGGPYTMTVRGSRQIRVRDVLVGEVWIASGQSNMDFALERASTAGQDLPSASDNELRFFRVARATSLEPLDRASGEWRVSTPEAARAVSAVAYYFARDLRRRLGVPVGIVQSTWSGTQAEEWTDPSTLSQDPDFAPILQRWSEAADRLGTEQQPAEIDLQFDALELIGPRTVARAGRQWEFTWQTAPNLAFDIATAPRLRGTLRASETAHLRTPAPALMGISALRMVVRGRGFFKVHILQRSVTDWDNYAWGPVAASPDAVEVVAPLRQFRQAGWGRQVPWDPALAHAIVIEPLVGRAPMRPPAGLFNGMIAPLAPYAMRGVVWYQGEGNAGRAWQYRKLLPALIRSWRKAWGAGDFAFLIAQLPNYRARKSAPGESDWAELREAQLMTLAVPHTGLAVTIDAGEAEDVHPREKQAVGVRLARWALGSVYNREAVWSGPLYRAAELRGKSVRVRFAQVGSGLRSSDGKPLRGFAVAGADRRFVWADARVEGDSVVVSSARVAAPAAVRYAWADNPDCNLVNREGLPASPFRTDDWPGITFERR